MSGRRDDDRRRWSGNDEPRRGEYQASGRGDGDRNWDEHGYERGPERLAWDHRDTRGADENLRKNRRELPNYGRGYNQDAGRADGDDGRDFEQDRAYGTVARDRDRRDYERDRDYSRAARELDRATEYGRDFNRDRELDRRARDSDEGRTGRHRGDSPSGAFHAFQEEPREERERPRRQGDRTERDPRRPVERDFNFSERGARGGTGRIPENDPRYGGRESGGHGPGVENMAPPRVGYGTSPSRRDDHEMGHGGYLGGAYRSATPGRLEAPSRPASPGRGPKSYQRGDDRIRADLCDRLMQGWMDASDVDVMVKDGEVTLSGTVRSRDEKRAIEDLADGVLGVKDVINNIRINRAEGVMRHQASEEPVARPGADTGDDRGLHS
jgi:hypothetical protein